MNCNETSPETASIEPGKWYLHKSKVQPGACLCSQEKDFGPNYEKIGGPYATNQECEKARKGNPNCKARNDGKQDCS